MIKSAWLPNSQERLPGFQLQVIEPMKGQRKSQMSIRSIRPATKKTKYKIYDSTDAAEVVSIFLYSYQCKVVD